MLSYPVLYSLSLLWKLNMKLTWLTVERNSQNFAEFLNFLHCHYQGVTCHAANAEAVPTATDAYKLLSLSSQISDFLNCSFVMLQNFLFPCFDWNKREQSNWIALTYHRRHSLLKFLCPNPRWPHSGCIADSVRFYSSHVAVECVVLVCLKCCGVGIRSVFTNS